MPSLVEQHEAHIIEQSCSLCDGLGAICAICDDDLTDLYELITNDSLTDLMVCIGCKLDVELKGAVPWLG